MNHNSHGDGQDPPPPYSQLEGPRQASPHHPQGLAPGRSMHVNVWTTPGWNFEALSTASSSSSLTVLDDRDRFEDRDMEEHLDDPFAPPSEAGKQLIITSQHPSLVWLSCHHKVFPAYWQCMSCQPRDTFNRWDVKAMHDSAGGYRPSCSRPNCRAPADSRSVLANAQKEAIMTLGGENLMPRRVEDPFMWCCTCAGLRGEGRSQSVDCAHCVNVEESSCPDCVRCNGFLEPTRFRNGDIVHWGVLDVCSPTQRGRGARSPRSIMSLLQGRGDSARAAWLVSASSLILGSSIIKAMHRQTMHQAPNPIEPPARLVSTPSRGRRRTPQTPPDGANSRNRGGRNRTSPPTPGDRPRLDPHDSQHHHHRQPSDERRNDDALDGRDDSIYSQSLAYAASVRAMGISPSLPARSLSPHAHRPRRGSRAARPSQQRFDTDSRATPLPAENLWTLQILGSECAVMTVGVALVWD